MGLAVTIIDAAMSIIRSNGALFFMWFTLLGWFDWIYSFAESDRFDFSSGIEQ